jgi:hypothetical protein
VSSAGTIAKLEALLARVKSRSAGPRPIGARSVDGHAAPRPAAPPAVERLDEEPDQPTLPPPPVAEVAPVHAPPPPVAPALELAVEVDVGTEELATQPTNPTARAQEGAVPVAEATSSQERLVVAADAAPIEMPDELPAPEPSPPRAAEQVAAEPIEEPPASSRRPLAPQPEERLAEMAFGAAEPRPPLHTPPPESGRLPAAPEVEFPDEDTGVHAAPSPASSMLTSETTRADLGPGQGVASMQGGVRAFHPATFAELLDASLGL